MIILEFNNEIIDGQSTVADNLAKSNRNFMLLKEILGSGASSQDIQNMLETISQTYVKTADIVNNLNSSDTNKPVSAAQAKELKDELKEINITLTNIKESLEAKLSKRNIITQEVFDNLPAGNFIAGDIPPEISQNINLRNYWSFIAAFTHRNNNAYRSTLGIEFDGTLFTRTIENGQDNFLRKYVEYFDNTNDIPGLTEKANNPVCAVPYIMTINETVRNKLGIPSTGGLFWGNIHCYPNPNRSGYACQVFYSMVSGMSCKRVANAHNWGAWVVI